MKIKIILAVLAVFGLILGYQGVLMPWLSDKPQSLMVFSSLWMALTFAILLFLNWVMALYFANVSESSLLTYGVYVVSLTSYLVLCYGQKINQETLNLQKLLILASLFSLIMMGIIALARSQASKVRKAS